jgi:hypothetical protein
MPKTQLLRDVEKILATFRKQNGYQDGMTWIPERGTYDYPSDKGSNKNTSPGP